MKRFLSVILMVALVLTSLPSTHAKAAFQGEWEYELITDGVRLKSYNGSGGNVAIPNTFEGSPVIEIGEYAFSGIRHAGTKITSVTIPATVASIGQYAFENTTNLSSITIPGTVKTIGNYAFDGSGITSSIMQNGVASMGTRVFNNCTKLQSVSIPNSVTSIPSYAFNNCSSLNTVSIPSSITTIGSSAFNGCKGLTNVTFNSGNDLIIGSSAFQDCTGIQSINIPASVTSIGSNAFYGCTSLANVTLNNGVKTIGSNAFRGCTSLTSIGIPASVTGMTAPVFNGCSQLTSINVNASNESYSSDNQGIVYNQDKTQLVEYPNGRSGAVTIPATVKTIGSNAFYAIPGLTSITIPGTVTALAGNAFYECSNLQTLQLSEGVKTIGNNAFIRCTKLSTLIIPSTVTSIGSGAFSICTSLSTVVIGTGVQTFGNGAFSNCTNLSSVTIEEGVQAIGETAFSSCPKLTTLNIPSSVKTIGVGISRSSTMLTSITVNPSNANFSSDAQGILYNKDKTVLIEHPYGRTDKPVIPNTVTDIKDYAFYNCNKLTDIDLPNSITNIGNYAFYGCSGLQSLRLSEKVTSIGNYAFYNCSKITSVIIPEGVISIGNLAFYGWSSLLDVELPEGIESIGNNAFSGGSQLTSLKIPGSVTSLGTNLTYLCPKLTTITVDANNQNFSSDDSGMLYNKDKTSFIECPYGKTGSFIIADSVTTIKSRSFNYNPNLTSISIPAKVATIEGQAFYLCSKLGSVIFNNPETVIASNAFVNCNAFTTVYGYGGSTAETFAAGKTFIMMGDPITLIVRKDGVPLKDVDVSGSYLEETKKTDAKGMVYFPVDEYDTETNYEHVIGIGDNLYKYSLKGEHAVIVDFKTLKVVVLDDAVPVEGAYVSIDTQSTLPILTDENGVAEFLLPDGPNSHLITVESDEGVGQISMTANEMDSDGAYTIHIDNSQVKRKTITGKALHGEGGVSGIVLTATKEGEAPLYARTKLDGTYRFILPQDCEGAYTIDVIDDGDYGEGILLETQLQAEPEDTGINFIFEDGLKLEGTVTNTQGEPLPKTEFLEAGGLAPTVKLYLEKDNRIWTTESTEGGKYEFKALQPGVYNLSYGISNYIYSRSETIELLEDSVKDIVLTNYSVSNPRNIQSDLAVMSPIEPGEWGTVSVRCQNLDEVAYEDLILEVEIPDGVIIEEEKLEQEQAYDRENNKVYKKVDLDVAGAFDEADFATFRFMYRIEDGYDKNKVVFTAFMREEGATSDTALKEYEVPTFQWSRTDEGKTKGRNNSSWKWSDLSGLTLDITEPEQIWDGQKERYYDKYGNGADTSRDYATWEYRSNKGKIEYRRFQTGFTKPSNEYKFSHILSENYAAYTGSGAVFPINDEIFLFVYPKGTVVTDNNASQYLAFWGSTQIASYKDRKFMGVEGNAAIQYKDVIPALKHSDYWVLDGTKNRINEIIKNHPDSNEFIVDVFTGDIAEGGGMDKFNLVFTNTQIQELSVKDKTMPYMDFIGVAHADVFKPTLTGDECVSVETARSSEYQLKGQSMKGSDVRILRLDTGVEVASFHADGYYNDIGTLLTPVAGTYPFIAECTKNGVTRTSNIHVVEVLENDMGLSNIQLTSATIQGQKKEGNSPFIPVNVWVNTIVDVSTTFNDALLDTDKVYYRLSGIGRSFLAGDENHLKFPPATTGTKDVSVIVVREDTVVFNKIIGRIYASIDPSGYVYDKHTGKRIEGATVTCYILNGSTWEVWKAENHGQVNPLTTDVNGRYAWDVPEGVYKVTVRVGDYRDYDTIDDPKYAFEVGQKSSIVIPPPRLDINMGMENIGKPRLLNSFPSSGMLISPDDVLTVEFNKAMKAETLTTDNITLDMEGTNIPIQIGINKTRNVITITPSTTFGYGTYTLRLNGDVEDYNTGQKLDATSLAFTVSEGVETVNEAFQVTDYSKTIGVKDGISVSFNQPIGAIEAKDVRLLNGENESIDTFLSLSKDKKNLKVYPQSTLATESTYTLELSGDIEGVGGLLLQKESLEVITLSKVKLPTVNTAVGFIKSGDQVALSCNTPDAVIRYTTDNSTPTQASKQYTDPIPINFSTTIKAFAAKEGMTDSDIGAFEYVVLADAGAVTVDTPVSDKPSGVVEKGSSITLSCGTEGATIRYTLDGSNPTASSTAYAEPITISSDVTIKAVAYKDGYLDSDVATFTYSTMPTEQVAAPNADPGGGTVAMGTKVTLSSGTESATIRYTLDGSNPTASSTAYAEPITISSDVTIKAVAYKDGYLDSDVATFTYSTMPTEQVAAPNADPSGGTVAMGTKVTLSSGTEGAIIRYTLNGSNPTTSSSTYTTPITVSSNLTIKAAAFKEGMVKSDVKTFNYTIPVYRVGAPSANPPSGNIAKGTAVTLSSGTMGATIRYTLDGSDPISSGTAYAGPIVVTANTTIKTAAFKDGMLDSAVVTFTYKVMDNKAISPIANPLSGMVQKGTLVELSSSTEGATIRYTLDGSTPSSSSTAYTSPIPITEATVINAIAYKGGMEQSAMTTFTYALLSDKEEDPIANTWIVILNPNGGFVSNNFIMVKEGEALGTLPNPNRSGYSFDGWYTLKEGGDIVTSGVKITESMTLYAHWSKPSANKSASIIIVGKLKYKVTKSASKSKKGSVQVTAPRKKTLTKVSIPATIKSGNRVYRVEGVAKNAFKDCTRLKKITIGKNVTKVGKKAFENIHRKAVIRVPNGKLKKYRKLLKGKGQHKTVAIK